uniref:Apyrase n=2 Tax=Kalanchoe fedtschenkoi TaxID=63787 RepID=A0A7N0UK39_KALFE
MVLSRIAGIISAAASKLSSTPSSTVSYVSAGLPPAVYNHNLGFPNSLQKNYLRLSSSLQDFSSYQPADPEEGDISIGRHRSSNHAKPPLHRENGASSFSKEKASPGSPRKRKKWLRAISCLVCLLLFAFLIYMVLNYLLSSGSKYYVVLDCGSTGTRVYVYEASANHALGTSLPIRLISYNEGLHKKPRSQSGRAYDRMETEPGLDKLVHNGSGLKAAIKPLLRWAKKQIPKSAHRSTSLFLYATAGVRRLPSADSKWLLDNAWTIINSHAFLCKREWVKTISGMEEAYYGWIALNYRTGVLGALPKKATFGALDLGGSSLQVTFESNEQHNETDLNLRIGRVNHHLSAYSLSGYGLNDAFDKSVVHLLRKLPQVTSADLINARMEVKHPCLLSDYKEPYNCLQCASLFDESGSPSTGRKSTGKGGKTGVSVKLIGAPNWGQCNALAKVAVNISEWSNASPGIDCEMEPCALSRNLPRPYGQFYGMSGFFVVYRFFNLTSDATLDDVLEKGREFCEKSWKVAKNSVAPQPFIEQYCFRAPYIVTLLREGLHIVDDQVNIGSGSITWTLGVALVEAGRAFTTKMPFQPYEKLQLKMNPIIIFLILSISLVFVVCAFACVGNGLPRLLRRSYLPLFRQNTGSPASGLGSPFGFRWSSINLDGRGKMPLSPVAANTIQSPFSSNIQLVESSSLYPGTSSVLHSYSSGSLGQMQFDNVSMNSMWPHRSKLQSRRSQSREDLASTVTEPHIGKL